MTALLPSTVADQSDVTFFSFAFYYLFFQLQEGKEDFPRAIKQCTVNLLSKLFNLQMN